MGQVLSSYVTRCSTIILYTCSISTPTHLPAARQASTSRPYTGKKTGTTPKTNVRCSMAGRCWCTLETDPNGSQQRYAIKSRKKCKTKRCIRFIAFAREGVSKTNRNKWMFLEHQLDTCHGATGSPEPSVAAHAPPAAQAPMLHGWMPFPTAHSSG